MRFFNTAGPINSEIHYYVPHRLDEKLIAQLIEQQKYFVLHAPRQSGKTTAILNLVRELNATGTYKAFYFNSEAAQAARSNVLEGMRTILSTIKSWGQDIFLPSDPFFSCIEQELAHISGNSLDAFLTTWASASDKPIVIFIDEIDSLVGDTLISVLRQLRSGYPKRPKNFPQAIGLIGVRDVRDYRIWSDQNQATVLGGSAFNIKAESLKLLAFSPEQVRMLYLQHTQETGQQFTPEAIDHAFYLTNGQPWLVNALAYEACFRAVTDRTITITKETIDQAKETLILRRDTHIDVLIDRLEESRVREIIDAVISGGGGDTNFKTDDLQYVRDLGLVSERGLTIANPIYQEIIPRELAYTKQESIPHDPLWYRHSDGSLDIPKLMTAFTEFYRENSDVWRERFAYKESGPHLLLLAFLQRIVNGGGKIHREYGLGRKRVDILIQWPAYPEITQQRIVIELKVLRGEKTLTDGLQQTAEYMDTNASTEGHLVIFDAASTKSWDEKVYTKNCTHAGKHITVWGL